MTVGRRTRVEPIRSLSARDDAALFLHRHLNPAVSTSSWRRLFAAPWAGADDPSGFRLLDEQDATLGVYAAVPSRRVLDGVETRVRNLAGFAVLAEHRGHSLSLLRAATRKEPGTLLTDLSPSGNVVAVNERLGFRRLEGRVRLVANVPAPRHRGTGVTSDPAALAATLAGADATVYADHRTAAAAHHVLVTRGDAYAYIVFRRDRRKRLPLFTTVLYAGGDRRLLRSEWSAVRAHLLIRHALPFTLAEERILGFADGPGRDLSSPRPRMIRGDVPGADRIDYLYSELALVSW